MKIKKYLLLAVPFLIALSANLYFRSYTINFPQLKNRARSIVMESVRNQVAKDVFMKFQQFYPPAREKIIKSRLAEFIRQNKKQIDAQTQDIYTKMKERYQDDSGHTYLMELDCWHWARYVENVVKFGRPGDETIYGNQWDILMLAPTGYYILWDQFLFYFSGYLYKAFCIFKTVDLFHFLFYVPLLFAAMLIAALYLFSFRLGGWICAFLSCLIVGLAPIFLPRSHAGWFDKDILNMFFPVMVTWFYLLGSTSVRLKGKLFWIIFAGLWVGLFAFTWTHWWFIFFIVIAGGIFFIGESLVDKFYFKKDVQGVLRGHVLAISSFIVSSLLWVVILAGKEPLVELYKQVTLALILNKPLMQSIWPNVYSTVGELKGTDIREIMVSCGGAFIFIPAVVMLLVMFIRALLRKINDEFHRQASVLLLFWLAAMFFGSFRGVRFVVFLLIPIGIAFGWMVSKMFQFTAAKKKGISIGAIALFMFGFTWNCLFSANKTSSSMFPLINDTWYKILTLIKEKTPEQTILNSWWDYGDWFKVVARRRVIFDGQSQDSPQAYWMAKAILSTDEEKAVRILRMLNNGGNRAFEVIDKELKNPLQSVMLLESVLSMSPEQTEKTLKERLPEASVKEVMKLLFSIPSRACFIVEDSMIPKMGAISYLGNWDFAKVYIAQNLHSQEKDEVVGYLKGLNRDPQDIQRFYQEAFLISDQNLDDWLSRRVYFYSGLVNGQEKEGMVYFENGFVLDLKELLIRSNSGQLPMSLFILQDKDFIEKQYPNPNLLFSALVVKKDKDYKLIFLDRDLASSMFVRLYLFNGLGLKHFIPFIEAEEGNNYIRVYNIAW